MITREAIEAALQNPDEFKPLVDIYLNAIEKNVAIDKDFFNKQRIPCRTFFLREFPPSFVEKWIVTSIEEAGKIEFTVRLNLVHYAVWYKHLGIVEQYCRLPNYFNAFNAYTTVELSGRAANLQACGTTPLIFAIKQNNKKIFKALIKAGVDINKPALFNNQELPPICYALFKSRFHIAQILINAGCNLKFKQKGLLLECIIIGISNKYNKSIANINNLCNLSFLNTLDANVQSMLNKVLAIETEVKFSKSQSSLIVSTPPLLIYFLNSNKLGFEEKKALFYAARQKQLISEQMAIMHHLSLEEISKLKSIFVKNTFIQSAGMLVKLKNLLNKPGSISDKELLAAIHQLHLTLDYTPIIMHVGTQELIRQFVSFIATKRLMGSYLENLAKLINHIPDGRERNVLLLNIGQALVASNKSKEALNFLTLIPDPDVNHSEDSRLRESAQALANNLYESINSEKSDAVQSSPILLSLTEIREKLSIASTNEILEEFVEIPAALTSSSSNEASTSGSSSSVVMYATTFTTLSEDERSTSDNGFYGKIFKL